MHVRLRARALARSPAQHHHAHALPAFLPPPDGLKKFNVTPASLKTWETAAHYHLVHAVALFAAGATNRLTERTGWMFMTGITLFSGSLYMLVLTGKSLPWGPITPIGGLTLVGAWLALAATPGPGKGSE